MANSIVTNYEGIDQLVLSLDAIIDNITDIFSSLNIDVKEINGSSDTWQGLAQEENYKIYLTISKKYTEIIENLSNYVDSLIVIKDNWKNSELKIGTDVANNEINLDVN